MFLGMYFRIEKNQSANKGLCFELRGAAASLFDHAVVAPRHVRNKYEILPSSRMEATQVEGTRGSARRQVARGREQK